MVFFSGGNHISDYHMMALFGELRNLLCRVVHFLVQAHVNWPEHAPIIVEIVLDEDIRRSLNTAPRVCRRTVVVLSSRCCLL